MSSTRTEVEERERQERLNKLYVIEEYKKLSDKINENTPEDNVYIVILSIINEFLEEPLRKCECEITDDLIINTDDMLKMLNKYPKIINDMTILFNEINNFTANVIPVFYPLRCCLVIYHIGLMDAFIDTTNEKYTKQDIYHKIFNYVYKITEQEYMKLLKFVKGRENVGIETVNKLLIEIEKVLRKYEKQKSDIDPKKKTDMNKSMREMLELRKLISSEYKDLLNGIPMVKLASQIYKEANFNLEQSIELYKEYKTNGKIRKLYEKISNEMNEKRKNEKKNMEQEIMEQENIKKKEIPKALKEMMELRKLISFENKELPNGVSMVKLTNKIFKEAKSDLDEAIELYKKYKQNGDIQKFYKEMVEDTDANRAKSVLEQKIRDITITENEEMEKIEKIPIEKKESEKMSIEMKEATETKTKKRKKEKIPETIKANVWNKYIGEDIGKAKCLCCGIRNITQRDFHCGHVISEHNGGKVTIKNLRPICQKCNNSMGIMNLDEFKKRYDL
jgi:hypothetical protein